MQIREDEMFVPQFFFIYFECHNVFDSERLSIEFHQT